MDKVTVVSVPIVGTKLDIFAREGQIFARGSYFTFFHGICKISKSYQI